MQMGYFGDEVKLSYICRILPQGIGWRGYLCGLHFFVHGMGGFVDVGCPASGMSSMDCMPAMPPHIVYIPYSQPVAIKIFRKLYNQKNLR